MSRKRDMQSHISQLHNIRNVMGALKNLAVLESQKLTRRLDNTRQMARELEWVGADLTTFMDLPSAPAATVPLYLVFGSERGFCGDYNEILLRHLDTLFEPDSAVTPCLIIIGQKLASRLDDHPRVLRILDGATVADDVDLVLGELVNYLNDESSARPELSVVAIYHDLELHRIQHSTLIPNLLPDQDGATTADPLHPADAPPPTFAPLLNLPSTQVLQELLEHYLLTRLHEIGFQSLSAENHHRIQHLTGAIRKLDDTETDLTRRYHVQRQEEITEEIEVILLNGGFGE